LSAYNIRCIYHTHNSHSISLSPKNDYIISSLTQTKGGIKKYFEEKKNLTQTRHLDKKIKLTLTLSVREQILQHYIHQQKRKPTEGALGPSPPCKQRLTG
jgi:hypothetical protein